VHFVDKEQALEIALIENLQREDLTAVEEAFALKHIKDHRGLTDEAVAAKVGKQRSTVSEILTICNLPATILNECRKEKRISKRLLIHLASISNNRTRMIRYNAAKRNGFKYTELSEKSSRTAQKSETIEKMFGIIKGMISKLSDSEMAEHKDLIDVEVEAVNSAWTQRKNRNVGAPTSTESNERQADITSTQHEDAVEQ
jgi:ParB family chromosome partitioning protein